MSLDDALRAVRESIGEMPRADLRGKLNEIKARHAARDQHEIRRQEEDFDILFLDEAAYEAAGKSEADGDLHQAVRWYTAAAENDYADAPLRLATVLDVLAREYLTSQSGQTAEELRLVKRASWWYAEAFAAGEIEAAELLENLSLRHDPAFRWTQGTEFASATDQLGWARAKADKDANQRHPGTVRESDRADEGCALGGLRNVIDLGIPERLEHTRSCQQCYAEVQAMLPIPRVPVQR